MAEGLNKSLREQARDQALHLAAAAGVTALVLFNVDPITASEGARAGFIVGLALGMVREVTEGGDVTSSGSVVDLIFWTLGGVVTGHWIGH